MKRILSVMAATIFVCVLSINCFALEPLSNEMNDLINASPSDSETAIEDEKEDVPDLPIVLSNDGEESTNERYPIGSTIDEYGNVFSPDGELLSSEIPAGSEENTEEGMQVLSSVVSDLRDTGDSDLSSETGTGLKGVLESIFGVYTPVTTTTAYVEVVDGVQTTYLIDTVASGAAGVDYVYLAGVLLFALLLYCVLRMLGGVLK